MSKMLGLASSTDECHDRCVALFHATYFVKDGAP